jgi:hypothetical protein
MYLCPYDSQWCTRPGCRSGTCELTGERPSVACINCGSLMAGPVRVRLCVDCLLLETSEEKET